MKWEEIDKYYRDTFGGDTILKIFSSDFTMPITGKIIDWPGDVFYTNRENKWRFVEMMNQGEFNKNGDIGLTKLIDGNNIAKIEIFLLE